MNSRFSSRTTLLVFATLFVLIMITGLLVYQSQRTEAELSSVSIEKNLEKAEPALSQKSDSNEFEDDSELLDTPSSSSPEKTSDAHSKEASVPTSLKTGLRGIVLNQEGNPVPDALVYVSLYQKLDQSRTVHSINDQFAFPVEEDGTFEIEGLDNSNIAIAVKAESYSTFMRLSNSLEYQEITLEDKGIIVGIVRDKQTEKPIQTFQTIINARHRSINSDVGIFLIEDLDLSDSYNILVMAEGYHSVYYTDNRPSYDRPGYELEINMEPINEITIEVRDVETAKPIHDASVVLINNLRGKIHWSQYEDNNLPSNKMIEPKEEEIDLLVSNVLGPPKISKIEGFTFESMNTNPSEVFSEMETHDPNTRYALGVSFGPDKEVYFNFNSDEHDVIGTGGFGGAAVQASPFDSNSIWGGGGFGTSTRNLPDIYNPLKNPSLLVDRYPAEVALTGSRTAERHLRNYSQPIREWGRTSYSGEITLRDGADSKNTIIIRKDGYERFVLYPSEREFWEVEKNHYRIDLRKGATLSAEYIVRGEHHYPAIMTIKNNDDEGTYIEDSPRKVDQTFYWKNLTPGSYTLYVYPEGSRLNRPVRVLFEGNDADEPISSNPFSGLPKTDSPFGGNYDSGIAATTSLPKTPYIKRIFEIESGDNYIDGAVGVGSYHIDGQIILPPDQKLTSSKIVFKNALQPEYQWLSNSNTTEHFWVSYLNSGEYHVKVSFSTSSGCNYYDYELEFNEYINGDGELLINYQDATLVQKYSISDCDSPPWKIKD